MSARSREHFDRIVATLELGTEDCETNTNIVPLRHVSRNEARRLVAPGERLSVVADLVVTSPVSDVPRREGHALFGNFTWRRSVCVVISPWI